MGEAARKEKLINCVKEKAFIWFHHQGQDNDPESDLEQFRLKEEFKCSIYEGGAVKNYTQPQLRLVFKFDCIVDAETSNQPWYLSPTFMKSMWKTFT